jgi:DNA modification methylase
MDCLDGLRLTPLESVDLIVTDEDRWQPEMCLPFTSEREEH